MELIGSKGFVCLFESMDLPTMCHKSRLKAVEGDSRPPKRSVDPSPSLQPSRFHLLQFKPKGGWSQSKPFPNGCSPNPEEKRETKRLPYYGDALEWRRGFRMGVPLLECWMCWIGFSFLECSICSLLSLTRDRVPRYHSSFLGCWILLNPCFLSRLHPLLLLNCFLYAVSPFLGCQICKIWT